MKFERYGLGIAKGLTVTIKHLFRHPTVAQYPEQRLNISRRSRGNELVWSQEKCTGCATCAKTCPQGAIDIVTSPNLVDNKYEVEKYQVDTGYCIQCALCVEACPFEALFMGYAYERAKYRRHEVVQNKEDMMLESGEKQPSGYFYPEIAAELPRQTLLVERITEKK
ncbi:MAG: NADH-quinone oxidoreductase subunit I [Dehalococcoidales bacterium]|nr:NADH-quinone oxidoreductase subunit I [Dehalococcoidales bacterium]